MAVWGWPSSCVTSFMSVCEGRLLQFVIVTWFCLFLNLQFLHAFFKNSNQSGFRLQHKRSCISFILCIYIFVKSCITVSIWLYNEFSSRNLLRREGNDVMVQMLTLPFMFDNKCPLHGSVMNFTGRRLFVLRILLLFYIFLIFIFYFFTFLSFCLSP